MLRDKHIRAVALLCVILPGAWATTAQAQTTIAPGGSSRTRFRREWWVPPPPAVFWTGGRIAHVGPRHRFGQFFYPGLTYPVWPQPGYYRHRGGHVPHFYHSLVGEFYTSATVLAFPPPADGERGEWVAEWKDREPGDRRPEEDLSRSTLLKPGMSEEEVVRAVGSPVDRRRTAEGEVWKYSSFTLVVSAGKLIALR